MTHINLNGANFEVVKVKEIKPVTNTRTLEDCYKNPSATKVEVFDKWYNYTIDFLNDDYYVGRPTVSTYNTFCFTIEFNIYDCEWNFVGLAHITPYHNYLYYVS